MSITSLLARLRGTTWKTSGWTRHRMRRTRQRSRADLEALEERTLLSANPLGGQFLVHATLSPPENPASVAILDSAGDFITTWQSFQSDGSFKVFAKICNSTGTYVDLNNNGKDDDAFAVNLPSATGNQEAPTVSSDGKGDFVIAWQAENSNTANGYDILYRKGTFTPATPGTPGTPAVLALNTSTYQANTEFVTGNQTAPSVAMDTAGNFVLAWQSQDPDPANGYDIYYRRANFADAVQSGEETLANVTQPGDQITPTVAMGATTGSNFVLAWAGPGPTSIDGEPTSALFAQLYQSNGTLVKSEFQVNTITGKDLVAPAAAMDTSGDFVVAWQAEGQQGSGSDIYARRFDKTGDGIGDDTLVNTTPQRPQRAPGVGMDQYGNFLVAWQSNNEDGTSWGIYARRFDVHAENYGSVFLVNDVTTQGPQTSPAVAVAADGQTVVTWLGPYVPEHGGEGGDEGEEVEGTGGHTPFVHAHLYTGTGETPAGPASQEFLVNEYSAPEDSTAVSARDANGNFVVVWQSWEDAGDLSSYGIFAQRYNAAGEAQGDPFRVNTTTAGNQMAPAVAMDASGDFIIVWQSAGQDGSGYGIFAQRYNAAGVAQGGEFQINLNPTGDQTNPVVAMDANGNFVVVWVSPDASGTGIFARRFNANGEPLPGDTGDVPVNTYVGLDQFAPTVAMNDAGQYVIAWVSSHPALDTTSGDTEKSIFARWYDQYGTSSTTNEFEVNTYVADAQEHPSVGIAANGNFVVTWQSINQEKNQGVAGGSSWGVYARQLTPAGPNPHTPPEFLVNTTVEGPQRFPTVGVDPAGNFVIAWQSNKQDGSSWGVYFQQYNANGQPQGGETRANSWTDGPQILPVVATTPNATGDFGIFWLGMGSGHIEGAYGQLYQAQNESGGSTPPPAPIAPALAVPPPSVSLAFGPMGLVMEVVSSTGVLTQFDATGVHVLGAGIASASVAFGPSGQVLLVTYQNGRLYQYDAFGGHFLSDGVRSASIAFGPQGEVLDVVYQNGMLFQYDPTGGHLMASGVSSASVAFSPQGQVLDVIFENGLLFQWGPTGGSLMGSGVQSASMAFSAAGTGVLDILFTDGTLATFDATGRHDRGKVL